MPSDGAPQWNQLIPCARRDHATDEFWGLPVFHPRLHLAAAAGLLAVGAEQEIHRYETSGERLWTEGLPSPETSDRRIISTDLPTREQRLSRLGIGWTAGRDQVRTGYLRLKLDGLLNAGWLKQVQISDIETATHEEAIASKTAIEIGIGLPFKPGLSALHTSFNAIIVGTQDGFVHVFDREGVLQRSFQVGETAVTDLLAGGGGLKAACCGGRLTLFDKGRVSATTELPEHFAELETCGNGVLAWKLKSLWLVDASGRVQLAAESDRPIRGVWGCATGFYVLAGGLASFQVRPVTISRKGGGR